MMPPDPTSEAFQSVTPTLPVKHESLVMCCGPSTGLVAMGVLCSVCTVMLAGVTLDGRSMFLVKESVREVAGTDRVSFSSSYGIGVFHDANGEQCGGGDTLLVQLGCDVHDRLFVGLTLCCFVAIVAAALGVLVTHIATATRLRVFRFASLAVCAFLCATLAAATALTWTLWHANFQCRRAPLRVRNHFALHYGPFLVTAAFVLSCAAAAALVAAGMRAAQPPARAAAAAAELTRKESRRAPSEYSEDFGNPIDVLV
ncbi:hypothetical protein DIPPA_20086 [Diplonema papillatum]|nr:hypothetical protein DIPPA_20086 [Diplonema papillatum]